MKCIDLTLEQGGGGGGTSNHAQLTNLDYANSGHTGFMSSANFLPDGTVITVGTNNADYTDLQNAINSLNGKWSNGTVYIDINADTYNVSNAINFTNSHFNFERLYIRGNSSSDTIINTSVASYNGAFVCNSNVPLVLTNFKITTSNGIRLIYADTGNVAINDVECEGCSDNAIHVTKNAIISLENKITISNCTNGIYSESANIRTSYQCNFIFSNVTTAVGVLSGGIIQLNSVIKTFTNVTNQTSQTIGTANSSGYITGSWS